MSKFFLKKLSLTVKTDDVTSNTRDVDRHGRLPTSSPGVPDWGGYGKSTGGMC